MQIIRFKVFEWDKANIEHIARHQVTPEEAEEVFQERVSVKRVRDDRYMALGQTEEGRYLAVVFIRKNNVIRVITARDMEKHERTLYKRKGS